MRDLTACTAIEKVSDVNTNISVYVCLSNCVFRDYMVLSLRERVRLYVTQVKEGLSFLLTVQIEKNYLFLVL